MKKMMMGLVIVLWTTGAFSAGLVDGGFSTTGTTGDTLLKISENLNAGWYTGSTGGAVADGSVGNYLRPDLAANYFYCFGQIWSETTALTGNQQLTIDFSNIDLGDVTDPELHIGIYYFANETTGQIRTGFPANDTVAGTIADFVIDLTTISAGTWTSGALDFTGSTQYYGIRMSFEATADAGNADGFSIDNVAIGSGGPAPQQGTFIQIK